MKRCEWVPDGDELYVAYHDEEWGVPLRDDRALYELLTLEGAQAGLSWATILRKREGYRKAFAGFDPKRVAAFKEARVETLLQDPGIVRNRLKVSSAVENARRVLEVQAAEGASPTSSGASSTGSRSSPAGARSPKSPPRPRSRGR
jgi:DNA-3-methyladenine glycosylase I